MEWHSPSSPQTLQVDTAQSVWIQIKPKYWTFRPLDCDEARRRVRRPARRVLRGTAAIRWNKPSCLPWLLPRSPGERLIGVDFMLREILHGNGPLAGRRIAVLAVDGFELVELVVPANAMRLAGATVDVISIHPGHIRGMNLHEPGMRIGVDLTLDEANPDEYDGLLIPGGFVN